MHKFSRQHTFLENLLLSIITANPLEGEKAPSDQKRLTVALLALTGEGLGVGSSGLNDELAVLSMASERAKDLAYTGKHKNLLPNSGRPNTLKNNGKPRSVRMLAREAASTDYDDASADRLRKKYIENEEALQRSQTALGDDNIIQKGFEHQAIQEIITLLNSRGVDAKINEIEF